jgi:hypothetical protein
MILDSLLITSILALGNQLLSAANVIIAFSLLVYILTHNFRSPVARGFLSLLTFITIVYVADVIVYNVVTEAAALSWLRFQWLGIAFLPAAYIQFADAVLRNTGSLSRWRNLAVPVCYMISLVFCLLAAFTDVVVQDGIYAEWSTHLSAGPLFAAFIAYFVLTTLVGLRNIRHAWQRCLTSTSRRRMTYLGLASVAPLLGLFPYMLIASISSLLSVNWVYVLSLVSNGGVAFMTVVMGYAVAYHGVLTPDRAIKHNMIHYLLRGPLVGIAIIALMLTIPRVERILGLPRDVVLIFIVTVGIVLFQLIINVAKPYIDRLIYREDRDELARIQTLDQRLFTTTDLQQLLENSLATVCDLLRVRTGFVAAVEGRELELRVSCGSRDRVELLLANLDLAELSSALTEYQKSVIGQSSLDNDSFMLRNSFWLLPLQGRDEGNHVGGLCPPTPRVILGIMGVEAPSRKAFLSAKELEGVGQLLTRASRALEDKRLQQEIFGTLQRLAPEIEELQRFRSTTYYARPQASEEPRSADSPDFQRWIKEALTDYWGGRRLSESPLRRLRIVEQALPANDNVPAKALRSALLQAIEKLRPAGERKYTASEWLLYNILELRFLKGIKTAEIAQRLAISPADFFRKQNVAIAEVAKVLADMEALAAQAPLAAHVSESGKDGVKTP